MEAYGRVVDIFGVQQNHKIEHESNKLEIGLFQFLKNEDYSDVTLRVGSISFPAHRVILMSRSPYFRDYFMKNPHLMNSSDAVVIEIEKSTPEALSVILDFIYTDRIKMPSDIHLVHQILDLVRRFQLTTMEAIIVPKFKKQDSENQTEPAPKKANLPTLWTDLTALFNDRSTSDISFIAEGTTFYAHKVILTARSSYFASLLRWNWRESCQDTIVMQEVCADVVELVLHFIYTNQLLIQSIPHAQDLLKVAHFFHINEMGSRCEQYLARQTINVESVCHLWNYSREIQADTLDELCKNFFIGNFLDVSQTSSFLDLDEALFKVSLNAGALEVHEDLIFEAVKRWGRARCEKPDDLDRVIQNLLPPKVMFNQRIKYNLLKIKKASLVELLW